MGIGQDVEHGPIADISAGATRCRDHRIRPHCRSKTSGYDHDPSASRHTVGTTGRSGPLRELCAITGELAAIDPSPGSASAPSCRRKRTYKPGSIAVCLTEPEKRATHDDFPRMKKQVPEDLQPLFSLPTRQEEDFRCSNHHEIGVGDRQTGRDGSKTHCPEIGAAAILIEQQPPVGDVVEDAVLGIQGGRPDCPRVGRTRTTPVRSYRPQP